MNAKQAKRIRRIANDFTVHNPDRELIEVAGQQKQLAENCTRHHYQKAKKWYCQEMRRRSADRA